MTQEEKQLLLKDLSARLFYGVKVWYKYETWNSKKFATSIRLADKKVALSSKFNKEGDWFFIEEAGEILIKPYLRSMSSMTDEERTELKKLCEEDLSEFAGFIRNGHVLSHDGLYMFDKLRQLEFCLSHHFDYRGLIEKGLALEASSEMYN